MTRNLCLVVTCGTDGKSGPVFKGQSRDLMKRLTWLSLDQAGLDLELANGAQRC